jgi:hypothetical protein
VKKRGREAVIPHPKKISRMESISLDGWSERPTNTDGVLREMPKTLNRVGTLTQRSF